MQPPESAKRPQVCGDRGITCAPHSLGLSPQHTCEAVRTFQNVRPLFQGLGLSAPLPTVLFPAAKNLTGSHSGSHTAAPVTLGVPFWTLQMWQGAVDRSRELSEGQGSARLSSPDLDTFRTPACTTRHVKPKQRGSNTRTALGQHTGVSPGRWCPHW